MCGGYAKRGPKAPLQSDQSQAWLHLLWVDQSVAHLHASAHFQPKFFQMSGDFCSSTYFAVRQLRVLVYVPAPADHFRHHLLNMFTQLWPLFCITFFLLAGLAIWSLP